MRKLYKDGNECMVDDHQIEIMLKSGWSPNKGVSIESPKPEETPQDNAVKPSDEEEESEEESSEEDESLESEDSDDKKTPKKIIRKAKK